MRGFLIPNIILIIINVEKIYSLKCGLEKIKIKPKSLNLTENKVHKDSFLKASSYTPIAIGYDFTTLRPPSSMSSSTFSNLKSLLQETREEFSKILQVRHTNINLSEYVEDIIDICEVYTIGKDYPNFLINNDLIIFPMFKDLGEGILAAAAPCIIDEYLRPIAGILYINNKLNFEMINTRFYMKNLLLHEITHILAFHPFFFEHLGMSKVSGSMSYITSPKALEKAREHFGCDSLSEIPLENQGGIGTIGAHWESRYMLGDYMISTDYPDFAISDITLALFEDTGFYKVNYYSGGLFKFGKNKGCSFFNKNCIENERATFDEFCHSMKEPICSSSKALKSSCYIVDYDSNLPKEYRYFSIPNKGGFFAAEYCPVPLEIYYENNYFPNHCKIGKSHLPAEYGESIGKDSLCFMSSLLPISSSTAVNSKIPICYITQCDSVNKNIIIKLGSEKITCPNEGGILYNPSGFKGNIVCPKYNEICNSDNVICNNIYDCFQELANKNKYNYKINYYDYSGSTVDLIDDYTDYIESIIINKGKFPVFNLALFILGIFLFFN